MIGDILQPTHLIFVLVVALLVLGPKRLPEVGRSLGRGLRDFRSALSGDDHDEVPAQTAPLHTPPPQAAEPLVETPPASPVAPEPEPSAHAEPAEQPEHVG